VLGDVEPQFGIVAKRLRWCRHRRTGVVPAIDVGHQRRLNVRDAFPNRAHTAFIKRHIVLRSCHEHHRDLHAREALRVPKSRVHAPRPDGHGGFDARIGQGLMRLRPRLMDPQRAVWPTPRIAHRGFGHAAARRPVHQGRPKRRLGAVSAVRVVNGCHDIALRGDVLSQMRQQKPIAGIAMTDQNQRVRRIRCRRRGVAHGASLQGNFGLCIAQIRP